MIRFGNKMRGRARWIAAAGAVVCVAGGWALMHGAKKSAPEASFQVKRDEFLDVLQFRGETKAMKSVAITAPADAGDLQIVRIAADGSLVKAGDVVAEFDASRTMQTLAQGRSTLKSAQAEIDQMRVQGQLTEESDNTALMKSRYDVDVAKLDASKSEVVSPIEGAEAQLKVTDSEQARRQAEMQLKSDKMINAANVEAKRQASSKARYDEHRLETSLHAMTIKSPASGVISLVPVWHNGDRTPFKAGERAWPGAPIAELPNAGSLRVSARVDETERGRLVIGQPVLVQLDALADRQFTGKIEHIGTIATEDFSAGWPIPRDFDLEITLDQADARLKPGLTAQVTVVLNRIPNAITIPTQATFVKSGKLVAYVWTGKNYEERAIQIEKRSRDRVLISSGLQQGDVVALKDPTVKE
jgi:RND family efflux transporter MFP subunit